MTRKTRVPCQESEISNEITEIDIINCDINSVLAVINIGKPCGAVLVF